MYSRTSTLVNTWDYLLSDNQGGVSLIANGSGGGIVGESFTAFGSRRNPSTWSGPPSNSDLTTSAGITRQGYTFQTQLGLWMGLNHMNGRVQDSITGRFLSPDPNIPDPMNTQSFNRYSYVNNNPLSYTDPSGFAGDGSGGGSGTCAPTGDIDEYSSCLAPELPDVVVQNTRLPPLPPPPPPPPPIPPQDPLPGPNVQNGGPGGGAKPPILVPGRACAVANECHEDNATPAQAMGQTAIVASVVVGGMFVPAGVAASYEIAPGLFAAAAISTGSDAVINAEVAAGIEGAEVIEEVSDAAFAMEQMNESTLEFLRSLSFSP